MKSGGFSTICEKRTTVTMSSIVDLAAVDLLEEVDQLLVAAELGVVVLDVARREVATRLTSTLSMTASKIFSRGEYW